ncbi:MAG: serine/threonine protein kinase [Lachnospiraceae bacterium]|nr:serine/threonine protein kinase [Lachnospiraceae bacterium]
MQEELWFGKYQILEQLSAREDTAVYLAVHQKLQNRRIIKVISKVSPYVTCLYQEANLLKNLSHPCIPELYDMEEDENAYYIVEQYMSGEVLSAYLSHEQIGEARIISYSLQLCDLILYLHSLDEPVYHLDLKPDNILIEEGAVRLIDFGSAIKETQKEGRTYTFGTPGFAAPEQYRNGNLDERADIYGIGMLMYYMAFGKTYLPVQKRNIDEADCLSRKVKKIINHCLQEHASERYPSVAVLKRKLMAIQKGKNKKTFTKEFKEFAVAGSEPHIGATHTALMLCQHLQQMGERCAYIEENQHNTVRRMVQRTKEVKREDEGFVFYQITLFSSFDEVSFEYLREHFTAVVYDYGVLDEQNRKEFLKKDVRLLVLGAKPWELAASEQALLYSEGEQVEYLFNFLNAKEYRRCIRNMESKNCYRIPYDTEPTLSRKSATKMMFKEVLGALYEY